MQTRAMINNRAARWWFAPLLGFLIIVFVGICAGLVHDDASVGLTSDELVLSLVCGLASALLLIMVGYGRRTKEESSSQFVSQSATPAADTASLLLCEQLAFEIGHATVNENIDSFYSRAIEILRMLLNAQAVALYRQDELGAFGLVAALPEDSEFGSAVGKWSAQASQTVCGLQDLGIDGQGAALFFDDQWLVLVRLDPDANPLPNYSHIQSQLDAAFRLAEYLAHSVETTYEMMSVYIRQFFELAENPMCLIAPDGFTILLCNEPFRHQYALDSSLEKGKSLFLDDTSCREHLGMLYHLVCDQSRRITKQLELLSRDGVRRAALIEVLPFFNAKDEKTGYVLLMFLDLSERQDLEARLARAARMEGIGQLAGGVAHDFNNILTVINGSAEFALENLDAGMDVTSDLEEILKAGRRAATLTRQLLAFSRKQAMFIETLNFNELIRDLSSMLQRLIQEDIELRMHLSPDLGLARADAGQMQQVLMNLVVNARDAIGTSGIITVETANTIIDKAFCETHAGAEAGPAVRLSVRDTGCGMSKEVLEHIFEPFFTTKGPEKGTGLGLASVFGIVKQLGGNIYASSVKGVGTCFDVYLPRVTCAESVAAPETKDEAREDSLGARIMVVEDQQQVRDLTVHMLRSLGYIAIGAENGNAALEFLTAPGRMGLSDSPRCPVDLLISDVVMPGMNGMELVEQVRQIFPSIAVLFMSGHSKELITQEMGDDTDIPLLHKPFSLNDLRTTIEECLEKSVDLQSF